MRTARTARTAGPRTARTARTACAARTARTARTACADNTARAASGRRTAGRRMGVVLGVLLVVGACSTAKPSHDAVKSKLKADTGLSSLKDSQLDCFTDVVIRYSDAGDLTAYVHGTKPLDKIRSDKKDEPKFKDEAARCVR